MILGLSRRKGEEISSGVGVMEDVRPSVSAVGNPHREDVGMEQRFVGFCKGVLPLDERLTEKAITLLAESKRVVLTNISAIGSRSPEEIETLEFAITLYIVKRFDSRDSAQQSATQVMDTSFTLYQLPKVAKIHVVDFLKEMSQFCLKASPALCNLYGYDWETWLQGKELLAKCVHLTILSKFYKRAFNDMFLAIGHEQTQSDISSSPRHTPDYLQFGWLLFLALRIHVLSRSTDLVTCTNGIVSILAILIIHVPIRLRKFSLYDASQCVRKSDKGVDLIASLCNTYDTSEDDLKNTIKKANDLIADILKKKPYAALNCRAFPLDGFVADGFTYFEDLMEEPSLLSSMHILEKYYEDAICGAGEMDERVFVDEEDSMFGTDHGAGGMGEHVFVDQEDSMSETDRGPGEMDESVFMDEEGSMFRIGSLSGAVMHVRGSKRKCDYFASPTTTITGLPSCPSSPPFFSTNHNSNVSRVARTRVVKTRATAKWLRTVVSPLPSEPSAELYQFLSFCGRDLTDDVIHRANTILEAIFPSSIPGKQVIAGSMHLAARMDSIWTEQRRTEALKLYYSVLVAICRTESQALHSTNLSSLLLNERFHRCMLACSAELVLSTHKTLTMVFPTFSEIIGITAFDLSEVMESFVRHEETLPGELKRHLNSLEERLLESMAWKKGSSMYNSLIVAKPSLAEEINRLGLLAKPMPSLDTIAMQHNITAGGLKAVQKHEPLADNQILMSPRYGATDSLGVLVEGNSFTSPVEDRLTNFVCPEANLLPPVQSAFASPTQPHPTQAGEGCAETRIDVFFGKVLKLAAIRIRSLCERLHQPNTVMESVYNLLQKILNQQTPLFFNRHVDQLILCSLYAVSKLSKLSLTFKEILLDYKKQPQFKPQVVRYVFVDWKSVHSGNTGQDHVAIITFYNKIFMPTVIPLLVELGLAGTPTKTGGTSEENKTDDAHVDITQFQELLSLDR